jgi:hypothetical protein
MFNLFLNKPTQISLEEALSNVILTLVLISHSSSILYVFSHKDIPLCGGGMNEKFNTILVKTQSLSIKCVVRHTHTHTHTHTLNKSLSIRGASGCKYFIISLMPSYLTNQKSKSCLMTKATNSSLNFLGQNLELLIDRDP